MLRGKRENGEETGRVRWQVEVVARAPGKASPEGDFCLHERCWGRRVQEAHTERAGAGAELAGLKVSVRTGAALSSGGSVGLSLE